MNWLFDKIKIIAYDNKKFCSKHFSLTILQNSFYKIY